MYMYHHMPSLLIRSDVHLSLLHVSSLVVSSECSMDILDQHRTLVIKSIVLVIIAITFLMSCIALG